MGKGLLLRRAALAVMCCTISGTAAGEDFRKAFPDIQTSSPHGVNLQTGQFSFTESDLAAGPIEVQRRYSGAYSNAVWPFSISAYYNEEYAAHPAFGIASNLRGYLYLKEESSSSLTVVKFVVYVEGQTLEFALDVNGDARRWTVATKGWSFERSGTDILIRNKAGSVYRFVTHSGLAQQPGVSTDGKARVLSSVTHADGTILTYDYASNAELISVSSNAGYRVNFAYAPSTNSMTACGFNLAVTYAVSTTACSGAQTQVQYNFGTSANGARQVTSVTRPDGTTQGYVFGTNMMTCVQFPNSSTCRLQNEYWPLHNTTGGYSIGNSYDQVTRQILADNSVWNYDYDFSSFAVDTPPLAPRDLTPGNKRYTYGAMTDPLNQRTQVDFLVGFPEIIWGPKKLIIDHTGVNFNLVPVGGNSATPFAYTNFSMVPTGIEQPEGDRLDFGYDDAGNNLWQRSTPKPGSGAAQITMQRTFPDPVQYATYGVANLCYNTSQVLCDKPLTGTDANNNSTTWTYDSTHGGLLTETGPAVNGVAPQKRYEYTQLYPWLKNSGGTWSQSATPIWVKTKEEFCKASAASGGNCTGGASDEVVTTYEYEQGSSTKGSNLLLKGVAVTADSETIRTCYTYDDRGRKLSETQPKGTVSVSVCP